ncbi:hypothetical protein CANCADRAFT_1657 [Tortispora caseinolytica NRRL Y-17796]|uniref:F-box domain-containing protein n=1 Tax=Tortispora caseinolytica NRRL Y-17796 TaxID=767744 RepID=A0A1E4TDU6_9ASCO|nr:hypothetical protein CANCADRAFT_1657 [Tortispora caseinolytica NRRL Y-17796]
MPDKKYTRVERSRDRKVRRRNEEARKSRIKDVYGVEPTEFDLESIEEGIDAIAETLPQPTPTPKWEPVYNYRLPNEIVCMIANYSEADLVNLLLVCKQFYYVLRPRLYEKVYLTPRRYNNFYRSISENEQLRPFVSNLQLQGMLQQGKSSTNARILTYCGPHNLTSLILPPTKVGLVVQSALIKCTSLVRLDMSYVSGVNPIDSAFLFKSLANLRRLEVLKLPYCPTPKNPEEVSSKIVALDYDPWPRLNTLHINGWFPKLSESMQTTMSRPQGLTEVMFQNSTMTPDEIKWFLNTFAPHAAQLTLTSSMHNVEDDFADFILDAYPDLRRLVIPVEHISANLFSNLHKPHNLQLLKLTSENTFHRVGKITEEMVYNAMLTVLPCLNTIIVEHPVGWTEANDSLIDVALLLEERDGGFFID